MNATNIEKDQDEILRFHITVDCTRKEEILKIQEVLAREGFNVRQVISNDDAKLINTKIEDREENITEMIYLLDKLLDNCKNTFNNSDKIIK